MAVTVLRKKQSYSFAMRSLVLAFGSYSILPFSCLSTLAEKNGNFMHYFQNPFAQYASTKFDISSVEIARMIKKAPRLQRLQTLHNVEEFVGILEENGCKKDQIARIMRSEPRVLTMRCEDVRNKLQLLKDSGICEEHLLKLLMSRAIILSYSLEKRLYPTIRFLLNLYQSHDLFLKSVLRSTSLVTMSVENNLKPSIAFWEGCGFRGEEILKLLTLRPSILRCISVTTAQLNLMQKIGVEKGSKSYKHIFMLVATARMATLEAKIRNFQLCGLSYEETMELIRFSPSVLGLSKENIRAKMDFVVKDMELPANSVIKHQHILYKNLDKVIKPRFFVWKILKSMNECENLRTKSFRTIVDMREAEFVTKILKEHPEAARLFAIYEKGLADALNCSPGTQISRECAS